MRRLRAVETRDPLELAAAPVPLVDVDVDVLQVAADGHLYAAAPGAARGHPPSIAGHRSVGIPTDPLFEGISSNLQLGIPCYEAGQLPSKLIRLSSLAPGVQAIAQRMEEATTISWLPYYPRLTLP